MPFALCPARGDSVPEEARKVFLNTGNAPNSLQASPGCRASEMRGIVCFQPANQSDKGLPAVVLRALSFVTELRPSQIVMLEDAQALEPFLRARGYDKGARKDTIKRVKGLAEFVIDHRFPIFVNTSTYHYRRIEASFLKGEFPDQAARVLASDLYHEWRHAAFGENEIDALHMHVQVLRRWRGEGVLTIADPYIDSKERELEEVRRTADLPGKR